MGTVEQERAFLTVAEVAETLGVSRVTAYRVISAGVLPARRIGRSGDAGPLRVDARELGEWLESLRTA